MAFLAHAVRPVGCLVLLRWIPYAGKVKDMIRSSDVQNSARCQRREYDYVKSIGLQKATDALLASMLACHQRYAHARLIRLAHQRYLFLGRLAPTTLSVHRKQLDSLLVLGHIHSPISKNNA